MIVSDLVASFFAEQPMNNAVNAIDRYGAAAIAFHWAMFLLVIAIGILGLLHDSWPKATQPFWINVHAVCGLALWLLLLARILGRAPASPAAAGRRNLLARHRGSGAFPPVCAAVRHSDHRPRDLHMAWAQFGSWLIPGEFRCSQEPGGIPPHRGCARLFGLWAVHRCGD